MMGLKQPKCAFIYRVKIDPTQEQLFKSSWRQIANYLTKQSAALSSTLHREGPSHWLIYSQWRSREEKEAIWPTQKEKKEQLFFENQKIARELGRYAKDMESCIIASEPPLYLEIIETVT